MKRAFTLAEVLITLGVIGVIAAITIPSVIKHYQKQAWTTQLKKSYTILNQAILMYMADQGITTLESLNSDLRDLNVLKKYIKSTDIRKMENYKYTYLNSNVEQSDLDGRDALIMADGTILFKTTSNTYIIDINGNKGPNKYGRDIFQFVFLSSKLYPKGSYELSKLLYELSDKSGVNPNSRNWSSGTSLYNCRTDKESKGAGCSARIIEKGKMDY